MNKKYAASDVEKKWIGVWQEDGIYRYDPDSKNPVYSIDTPPPYVSADHLHLGHAMSYIQAEIIVRFKRMQGYNVFYPMGFDDNGLPTERFVEKKYKINKSKISRSDFVALCIKETEKGAIHYRSLWESLGIGVDWSLTYNTIGEHAQQVSQKSFIDLYAKGLVYREEAPIFWCTTCQTALAQADLEDEDGKAKMYYLNFQIQDGDDITIATTRPEMIPACVALYVNPNDDRFNHLVGKRAITPIFNANVPVLAHEDVSLDIGTGVIMVCSWGDSEDVKKWKSDKLDTKILIDVFGRLTEIAEEFQGLTLVKARQAIVDKLSQENYLVDVQDIDHVKNVHERCGTPVEFINSKQWFIKILGHREEFLKRGNEIQWFPKFMKTMFDNWVSGLNWDWCISRDRYYGVPFPLWYCSECGEIILPEESILPIDPREGTPSELKCICGCCVLIAEKQVMDTWMTSSLTPLINARWAGDNNYQNKIYPMDMRVQAFEIIRTWLFYTVVKSVFHTDNIPWKSVMISGWGLDAKGKKMSKSKGNIVRIDNAVEQYSADSIRWWTTGVSLGQNLKYTDVDLRGGRKIVNKLWNVAKFVQPIIQDLENAEVDQVVHFSDRWIMAELQRTVLECTKALDLCDFNKARTILENFFWIKYCDTYLELCKDRTWNPEKYSDQQIISLKVTLSLSFEILLKLFAPILPFVTEEIYHDLFNNSDLSIHVSEWPKVIKQLQNEKLVSFSSDYLEVINKIRHFKTNVTESFRSEISSISIITNDEFLVLALGDLAGLAKAKKCLLSANTESGERYKINGGEIIFQI